MVDFSRYLKEPPKEADPNILTGTFMARIQPSRGRRHYERECRWEISPYPTESFGEWIGIRITKGGITGYESFILGDDKGLKHHALERIFITDRDGDWCCCAGGMGWDAMYVTNADLRVAIQQWFDREGIEYHGRESTCPL